MQTSNRTIAANGIDMFLVERGSGPLVVLCHGWPELSYSWRHQMEPLAEAGYHVVAPDMRGFGRTGAPADISAYSIFDTVGDVVALVSALGEKQAIIVGHDWGANVAWHAAMFRPDLFKAVAGLSVPPPRRAPDRPLEMLRKRGIENFYWHYFQTPGVAEAEFERDVDRTVRAILCGRGMSLNLKPGQGFIQDAEVPAQMPAWIAAHDVDHFVKTYSKTGYRGGLNWYRNIDRNWELTAPWQDAPILPPALFIAGSNDAVIRGPIGEKRVQDMESTLPNLTRKLLIDGAGHWIQQERPAEVNAALLEFLARVAG